MLYVLKKNLFFYFGKMEFHKRDEIMSSSFFKTMPMVLASFACSTQGFAKDCAVQTPPGCQSIELANGMVGCALQPELEADRFCRGYSLGASGVYWRPYIEGTEYGWTYNNASNDAPDLPINGSLLRPKLSFSWGFEFDIGYLFLNDDWKSDLSFTFHQGKGSNNFGDEWNQVIIPSTAYLEGIIDGDNAGSFENAKSHIHSDFYRLCLSLSRGTFTSRLLSITPGFGVTATWLNVHQTNKFSNEDRNVLVEKKESDAWDFGPTGLFGSRLWFGNSGFSLNNLFDLTLGFGKTDIKQNCYYSVSPDTNSTLIRDNGIRFSPKAHVLLGLQYETYFFEESQHLTLLAGLDTYIMWAGNRTIRAINGNMPQFEEKDASSFALIGLTLSANYQF